MYFHDCIKLSGIFILDGMSQLKRQRERGAGEFPVVCKAFNYKQLGGQCGRFENLHVINSPVLSPSSKRSSALEKPFRKLERYSFFLSSFDT